MEFLLYLITGLLVGLLIGFIFTKLKFSSSLAELDQLDALKESEKNLLDLEKDLIQQNAVLIQELDSTKSQRDGLLKMEEELEGDLRTMGNQKAELSANLNALKEQFTAQKEVYAKLEGKFQEQSEKYQDVFNQKSILKANLDAANEKMERQEKDLESLQKTFKLEFEKTASAILDQKTAKFTQLNQDNLKQILDPLNKDIEKFKKRVDEVYEKESKERFSLGEKVKELEKLNKSISEEARNLTQALKGEVKTQGRWGEMILERILENSGLRKGEEYEMESQLVDESGRALRSDLEDKKMRPDALINYPDNRKVIIDSKVSLNAFTRSVEAEDTETQNRELEAHVRAIKNHVIALSSKGYDDYDKALDFVMMFIPSEAAYIAAIKKDSSLWDFAYGKRILLMNPTNLITSLKLIEDLWKREYQNQNAIAIAERGGKLYDKFVGFVTNLEKVGDHLGKAQKSYSDAYGQLHTGKDNLVRQATKLKELGVKTKKTLPNNLNTSE